MTTPAADRGRRLEQHIGAYFQRHEYAVLWNQILTGRSGGRHEIDVLAEKSDALTTFKVAVECKAWASPIEKDVVSKLHYVMGDLGFHKGIVVSLAGCRSGALTAAEELGIEVWGPDELRRHLGETVFADVDSAPPPPGSGTIAPGYPFASGADPARKTVAAAGKGRLGLRTLESASWFAQIWMPAYAVRLTVAQPHSRRVRDTRLASVAVHNFYEALGGAFLGPVKTPLVGVELGSTVALRPIRRAAQVDATLRKAVEARLRVSSVSAMHRHDGNLMALGLPVPCRGMSIDTTELVFLPVYVGLLQSRGLDRVVAVSGATGNINDTLSATLTTHLTHLRAAFG